MWTLRDLFMWLSEDYKRKQMEQAARKMNNQPAFGNRFINDSNGYNLEDMYRMHPQRELLMNQWDKNNQPNDSHEPFYMRVQRPGPYQGTL